MWDDVDKSGRIYYVENQSHCSKKVPTTTTSSVLVSTLRIGCTNGVVVPRWQVYVQVLIRAPLVPVLVEFLYL